MGFLGGSDGKHPPAMRESWFDPWVEKIPWRRARQPIPIFLPRESHVQRSLVGYSPRGRRELDTTERLSTAQVDRSIVILLVMVQSRDPLTYFSTVLQEGLLL